MRGRKLTALCAGIVVVVGASLAPASLVYQFTFNTAEWGNKTLNLTAGQTVDVPIFLVAPDASLVTDPLFGAGVSITAGETDPIAVMAGLSEDPAFNVLVGITPAPWVSNPSSATLAALNDGAGVAAAETSIPGTYAIRLGTLTMHAGDVAGSRTFTIGDLNPDPSAIDTMTVGMVALDSPELGIGSTTLTVNVAPVPEPGIGLAGTGIALLALGRRRRAA